MSDGERILFIDDDPPVRTAFRRSLRGHGFVVDLASGAAEARQLMGEHAYGVVATDYRMPEVDGLNLIADMKLEQPDATYMLVSGECDLDLALDAVNSHGVSYVVCKPWDTEELVSVIKRSQEEYWERSTQRQMQAAMVQSSRSLDSQKDRLQRAVDAMQEQFAESLVSAMEMRGHETANHCRRVAEYALLVAQAAGLRGSVLQSIRKGALLHDIGEIGIPDSVLLKPAPLTETDWEIMRTHTDIGVALLEGFDYLEGARTVVAQHHERWDGSGYPLGLQGEQICIGARIFAICDALDAMTTDRPYRAAAPMAVAIAEIERCAGSQFDPTYVEVVKSMDLASFEAIRDQFPEPGFQKAAA